MARFKMTWRDGATLVRKETDKVKPGSMAHYSPWTGEYKGSSDVIYTHLASGIEWSAEEKKVTGKGSKPNQSFYFEDVNHKEFLGICDQIETGKTWLEICEEGL